MMDKDFLVLEGQKYQDFLLVSYQLIDELQLVLRELIHLPTGAQVMHLENDDPENLFCLSFKTLPHSSNGAPHILEHTVLCGSRKYPIKDPFFAMTRRSLNTFMNALTGSDFTCYPAASQVEKDFYNLLEVYIDAVFHPELRQLSFLQEGHRLEFSDPKDSSTPLEFKGIVYNEMKGSLTSADHRIWHELMAALVPDLPYAYNAGGDPKEIPHLTYQQLIDFHETYYHQSRCLFFFYGNFSLKKHLDFIAEHALKGAQKLPPLESIGHQRRFEKPFSRSLSYPTNETEELEKKFIHAFGWLTVPLLDQEEVLALTILDSVLMDTDASPLKKALLDTHLCIQADSFLDIEMTEIPLIMIMRGCGEDDGEKLEKALFEILEQISKEGIPFHLVESSIHQLEFARTEIGGDHSPFGLSLFMRSALTKQHGCDPVHSLTLHSLFEEILKKAKNPHFFSPLIEKYILNNQHFVRLKFTPDPQLISNETEEEKHTLQNIKNHLSDKQVLEILDQAQKLEEYQKQVEGQKLECLPKVTLADVPLETRNFPLQITAQKNLEIFHHEAFTNHIVYADLIFDLPDLSEDELFDLQLFLTFWPELGVGKRSYGKNLEFIHAHTGGIAGNVSLHVQAHNPAILKPSLQIHGKALGRKMSKLFQLFDEMATKSRFDEKKRIEDLIKKLSTAMQNRLSKNAMRYASSLALSGFSIPNFINQNCHGLTFYNKVQELAQNLKQKLPLFMDRVQALKSKILCTGQAELVLSCDEKLFQEAEKRGFYGLPQLPSHHLEQWKGAFSPQPVMDQARIINSPVAFTVQAFETIPYHHLDAPALLASTVLLENKILHHRIREQGGAYGAGAAYNPLWGNFYLYSYRDPHIAHTLRTFKNSIQEISDGNFDARDLEEAKLGIIQHLDNPTAPGNRAMVAYIWQREGKSLQMRQDFRDRLLALREEDVKSALKNNLVSQIDQGVVVTFAGKELLEKELPLIEDKKIEVLSIA